MINLDQKPSWFKLTPRDEFYKESNTDNDSYLAAGDGGEKNLLLNLSIKGCDGVVCVSKLKGCEI